MGFGDKLKDLRKQAQEAVSEHSEQLHNALDVAGTAANAKTRGKHTQRIAKFGEKASEKLDKFAAEGSEDEAAAGSAAPEAGVPEAAAPEGGAPEGGASVAAAEEPAATGAAEPETSVPPPSPPPAPSSPPPAAPAANPDLAAWAAGDDSASQ